MPNEIVSKDAKKYICLEEENIFKTKQRTPSVNKIFNESFNKQ